jgi:hypothetical protein
MDERRKSEIRAIGTAIKAAWVEQDRLYEIIDSQVATEEDRAQAAADHILLIDELAETVARMNGGIEDDPS